MKKFIALIMVLVMSLSLSSTALAGDYLDVYGTEEIKMYIERQLGVTPQVWLEIEDLPAEIGQDRILVVMKYAHRETEYFRAAHYINGQYGLPIDSLAMWVETHPEWEPLTWESDTDALLYTLKESGEFLREVVPGLVDLELVVTENGDYRVDMMVDDERYYVVLDDVPESGLIKAQTITDLYREWQER